MGFVNVGRNANLGFSWCGGLGLRPHRRDLQKGKNYPGEGDSRITAYAAEMHKAQEYGFVG